MNEVLESFKEYLLGMRAMRQKYVEASRNSQQTWDWDPNLRYHEGCMDTINSILIVFSSFFEEEGKVRDEK